MIEDFFYGGRKGAKMFFKFREEDGECGFNSYFGLDNLPDYKYSFSCKKFNEFWGEILKFIWIRECKSAITLESLLSVLVFLREILLKENVWLFLMRKEARLI